MFFLENLKCTVLIGPYLLTIALYLLNCNVFSGELSCIVPIQLLFRGTVLANSFLILITYAAVGISELQLLDLGPGPSFVEHRILDLFSDNDNGSLFYT